MHTATLPIAHLDLKPENVLVSLLTYMYLGLTIQLDLVCVQVEDKTFHVFVAGFGLGKVKNTQVFATATMKAGTPKFQSPEQLKGESLATSTDTYALGGVLTELFSEKPLWNNLSRHTITFKVAVEV